jgi:hypothetical protein
MELRQWLRELVIANPDAFLEALGIDVSACECLGVGLQDDGSGEAMIALAAEDDCGVCGGTGIAFLDIESSSPVPGDGDENVVTLFEAKDRGDESG